MVARRWGPRGGRGRRFCLVAIVVSCDARFCVKPRQPQFLGAGFPCFLHEPTGPVSPVVPVQGAAFVLVLVEASPHEIGILSVLIVTLYDLVDLVTIVLVETTGREVRRPDVEPTAGDSVVLQVVVQLRHHRLCQA